jgi:hypothetical protein
MHNPVGPTYTIHYADIMYEKINILEFSMNLNTTPLSIHLIMHSFKHILGENVSVTYQFYPGYTPQKTIDNMK